jgi:hypothetical protein
VCVRACVRACAGACASACACDSVMLASRYGMPIRLRNNKQVSTAGCVVCILYKFFQLKCNDLQNTEETSWERVENEILPES